jgi:hypothetical protein
MLAKSLSIGLALMVISSTATSQIINSGLIVNSNPPDAEAILDGPVTFRGLTPVTFYQGVTGNFNLKVQKPGYETYNSSIYLQSDKPVSLSVTLKPKTRFKAAFRSMFFPGWGQFYSKQNSKGTMFIIMSAVSGFAYLITDEEFDYRRRQYNEVLTRYESLTRFEDKSDLYPELVQVRERAYNAENERRIAIGAVIGVWGLNVLDALFFFPDRKGKVIVNDLSFKPDYENGGGSIVLSHNF